jgi:hypothetical protein
LEEKSNIGLTTNLVDTLGVSDFQEQKFKLEDEVKMAIVIAEDRNRKAFHGEALFKEAEEEFEIVGLNCRGLYKKLENWSRKKRPSTFRWME